MVAWIAAVEVKDLLMLLVGVVLGGLLSFLASLYFYRRALRDSTAREEEAIARYVVAAMLLRHPPRDSQDVDRRVQTYLEALRRTKADKRGVPVYREDGSIGVEWSLSLPAEPLTLENAIVLSAGFEVRRPGQDRTDQGTSA